VPTFIIRVLPESPRWLLSQLKFKEAEQILESMAKINGESLPDDCMQKLKFKQLENVKEDEKNRRYGIVDLFRFPNLRKKTLIITFIW